MEFNDFCNEIRDNIGEYLLGYDFDNIQLQEVTHNNNTTHTGLLISRSQCRSDDLYGAVLQTVSGHWRSGCGH